ncbi:MAG: 2-amino-4-hydroxy-6-hydroxymethyldihydropteridine diphosphokinase [bacterium]|nr:2-amino-4-hydroxy-6-hydroxymethyldihydropteridine diphosphokinase [bacterium]
MVIKTIYLGLGTNLGNKRKNIKEAIRLLRRDVKIVKVSSLYKTKPVGYLDQPDFLNAVAEIKTSLTPLQLLRQVKSIERIMGRTRTARWGPRLIDIDILLYEGKKIKHSKLIIPHPQINKRNFVLKPLKEIAPALNRKVFRWEK